MLRTKRSYGAPVGGLLVAGLAAFAYYKYSKLTPEAKSDLVNNLKERGKKLVSQVTGKQNVFQNNAFDQGSQFSG